MLQSHYWGRFEFISELFQSFFEIVFNCRQIWLIQSLRCLFALYLFKKIFLVNLSIAFTNSNWAFPCFVLNRKHKHILPNREYTYREMNKFYACSTWQRCCNEKPSPHLTLHVGMRNSYAPTALQYCQPREGKYSFMIWFFNIKKIRNIKSYFFIQIFEIIPFDSS